MDEFVVSRRAASWGPARNALGGMLMVDGCLDAGWKVFGDGVELEALMSGAKAGHRGFSLRRTC
jgi:hypothetical protein